MTNEELLKYIKENDCYVITKKGFTVDGINVYEAIEKSKAQKPRMDYYGIPPRAYCPNCDRQVFADYKVCPYCETRLDWEDEE